ncbi:MAG: chemotaxis protein CheW [Myxococcota bacterium]
MKDQEQPSLGDVLAAISDQYRETTSAVPRADRLDWIEREREEGTNHLAFRLNTHLCVIPLEQLIETLPPPPSTRVPGAPPWLMGVANIRGELLSIIGLSRYLALDERAEGKRGVLIARGANKNVKVGLLVDDVVGIRRVAEEGAHALPEEGQLHRFAQRPVQVEGAPGLLLDCARLVADPELQYFKPEAAFA